TRRITEILRQISPASSACKTMAQFPTHRPRALWASATGTQIFSRGRTFSPSGTTFPTRRWSRAIPLSLAGGDGHLGVGAVRVSWLVGFAIWQRYSDRAVRAPPLRSGATVPKIGTLAGHRVEGLASV